MALVQGSFDWYQFRLQKMGVSCKVQRGRLNRSRLKHSYSLNELVHLPRSCDSTDPTARSRAASLTSLSVTATFPPAELPRAGQAVGTRVQWLGCVIMRMQQHKQHLRPRTIFLGPPGTCQFDRLVLAFFRNRCCVD